MKQYSWSDSDNIISTSSEVSPQIKVSGARYIELYQLTSLINTNIINSNSNSINNNSPSDSEVISSTSQDNIIINNKISVDNNSQSVEYKSSNYI